MANKYHTSSDFMESINMALLLYMKPVSGLCNPRGSL